MTIADSLKNLRYMHQCYTNYAKPTSTRSDVWMRRNRQHGMERELTTDSVTVIMIQTITVLQGRSKVFRCCKGDPNRDSVKWGDPAFSGVARGDPTCTDRIRWEKAIISFTMLKDKIAKTPILKHFDPDRPPVIVVYASKWQYLQLCYKNTMEYTGL